MPNTGLSDLGAPSIIYTLIRFISCHSQSPELEALYKTELISVTSSLASIKKIDNLEKETNL